VPDIRWVCMSDTHFGAENSVLSHIAEGSTKVDPLTPSAALIQLVACLRTVVATNADERPPTLILHGDILELALAEDNVAATSFAAFIRLAFTADRPLFGDRIYYVPGNHDHHVWETARERQYATYIEGLLPGATIGPPWHVTRLFEDPSTVTPEAELLTAVLSRGANRKISVRIVYPNLGIESDDGKRVIIIHHGHFTEPLYRLMSSLRSALFPSQKASKEIWEWESDNFAWIDFFWSTLGRSGEAGADVGLVYDMLGARAALGRLAANLARYASDQLPRGLRSIARFGLSPIARWLVPKIGARERSIPGVVLSDKTTRGLREYLSGPLRLQLERERLGAASRDLVFVFGHTHKPFEREEEIAGFTQPVSLINSGGWVVDTKDTSAVQGASVVLIDAECGVASLRMYNQADDRSTYSVHLRGSGSARDHALQTRLEAELDLTATPWSGFSAEVAAAVASRHRLLPKLIEEGMRLTKEG
jgi:UDP-2,3-diacylglucosamine pyrophosphatase LpxH